MRSTVICRPFASLALNSSALTENAAHWWALGHIVQIGRYGSRALAEAAPLTDGLRFDLSGGAPQRNKTETPLAAPPFLHAQTVPGRIDTPAGTGANWCDKSQGRMK
jgi:hypothetical protein